jgi:phosphohistidine swiveling domain-containing protein
VDVAAPRYRDDPELLIKILLSVRAGATGADPKEKADHNREQRRKAYEFLYIEIKKKNSGKARRFQSQYKTFETFAGYRETHKFYLVIITDLLRRRILEKGNAWYKAGRLKSTEQIFDLTIEEIDAATSGTSLDLISQALKNRKFIDLLARISRPPSIMDSRGFIFLPPIPAAREGEVSGTPISPGVVRGRIKVLHSPDEKPLYKGEIMVARATDPGWTPLFVNAAGLILEIGGVLQHGALVAREYGLPCVAGIERATTLWNDGDLVEVDGSAGTVRKVT